MKELICPNCHKAFTVDEADYASIVNQVKNAEFNVEVERRIEELHNRHKVEEQLATAQAEKVYQVELNKKDIAITQKEAEIAKLKSELGTVEEKKATELTLALADKDREIAKLQLAISESESKMKIAVMEEQRKAQVGIQSKEAEIAQLKANAELSKQAAAINANTIKEQYELKLKTAQEQVDYYKDLKTRMSTKMIGETLEIHCSTQFNQMMRPLMPNAYFEKDNDASGGSKGDFIFKDHYYDDEGKKVEYVSIMFEMKNESDDTVKKHKNEDFFKELDKDRKEKKCEYAVLVSMLEADNDYYNSGIVDVSHRYPKMFVIRPQFFLPMISLIRNSALSSIEYKKELAKVQNQNIDVSNFEFEMEEFKRLFGMHYKNAKDRFDDAIKQIDNAIEQLENVRRSLTRSAGHLDKANNRAEGLTVKRLTKNSPSIAAKFVELHENE